MRTTLRSSYTTLNMSSLEDWLCAFGMEDALREAWEQVPLSAEAAQQKTVPGQDILMSRGAGYKGIIQRLLCTIFGECWIDKRSCRAVIEIQRKSNLSLYISLSQLVNAWEDTSKKSGILSYKPDRASKLRFHMHIVMESVKGDLDLVRFILGCRSSDLHKFPRSQLHHPFVQILFLRSMRIACLQFNPELGRIPENITRANALLQAASPQDVDILLLPELAFTGTSLESRLCLIRQPMCNSLTREKDTITPLSRRYCPTSNPPHLVRPQTGLRLLHHVLIASSQSAILSSARPLRPLQTSKTSRRMGKS